MKVLKKYKGQLLFTFILTLAILIMPFQDYAERTITALDMQYPSESSEYIREEDGILNISPSSNNHPVILTTENFYLKKGTYTVTFNVFSNEPGNYVDVCESLAITSDNSTEKLLATAEIPVTGENTSITFTINEYTSCIQFRIRGNSSLTFNSIYFLSEQGLYSDPYIYAGLTLLSSIVLFWIRTHRKIHTEVLFLLAFAAIWSSVPLSYTWLYDGHDMYFHYGRLFQLSNSLTLGQFPVRIHPALYQGMTYFSPVFYPESFLYPFAVLGILGMSPIGCYKLLLFFINFATAGISYYSYSRLCSSRKIGTIAAFLYTLSMYRLINLYTRAAIGELLATIFIPLLMLGMYRLFIGDSKKWFTAALAFTAILQSHIISIILAIGFSTCFALCFIRKLKSGKRLAHIFTAATTTLLLNLWFLVPLLDHLQYSVYTLKDTRNLSGYSLFASQIFDVGVNNPAALAEGPNTYTPEMPYSIGIVLLIGILLFLFTMLRKNTSVIKSGKYCLAMGILALYASSSLFPWDVIQRFALLNRIAGSIQFASRFLPFATAFLCMVSAIGIYEFFDNHESKQLLFILCAVLTVYSAGTYFSNYTEQSVPFVTKETQMDHTHDTDFMYLFDNQGEYFSVRKIKSQPVAFEPSPNIVLTNCYRECTSAGFTYQKIAENSENYVDVSFNNYPYFHAYDSQGNRLETSSNELLRLRILLPKAQTDTIAIYLELPGFYRISDCISLGTTAVLIGYVIYSRRKLRDTYTISDCSIKEN